MKRDFDDWVFLIVGIAWAFLAVCIGVSILLAVIHFLPIR